MKNILTLVFVMMVSTFAFGQIKVISPNGDVKVGNTAVNPTEKLDVDGNIKNRGNRFYIGEDAGNTGTYIECGLGRSQAGFSGIKFYNDISTLPGFEFNISTSGHGNFSQRGATSMQFIADDPGATINFRTGSATRIRILDNGNVGVGYNAPTHKLQVNGTAAKPGGGSWVAPSDKRLKKNINKFSGGLDEILAFKPVTFHYNGKAELSDEKEYIGVIAQDVEKIAPYMVDIMEYREFIPTDEDGEEILKASGVVEEYLTVDPNAFTYMLINAVKEQNEMLNQKDERIDDLESKLNALIDRVNDIQGNPTGDITPDFEMDVEFSANDEKGSLQQNNPNPFNGQTQIAFFIPENSINARIEVFNLSGTLMKSIPISNKGNGTINVDMKELSSSSFSYSLIIDNKIIETKQMVLQK